MISKMRSINPPINPNEVAAFERHVGITFPASYKEFLLATNGGRPWKSDFPIKDGSTSNIKVFLGIDVSTPTSELDYAYEQYGGALPRGVVPIASDDGGNYICLDLRSGHDKILFWEKSHFWSTGEWREKDLHDVAGSFVEFLDLLERYEPDTSPSR